VRTLFIYSNFILIVINQFITLVLKFKKKKKVINILQFKQLIIKNVTIFISLLLSEYNINIYQCNLIEVYIIHNIDVYNATLLFCNILI
jgi:hypothetical protein